MTSPTLLELWAKIRIELTAASEAVGRDPSATYYMDRNEFELAYNALQRFRGGCEKFRSHMKKAAQLMGLKK